MPEPIKSESQKNYVNRFMGSQEANKSFPSQMQRAAVAYSIYKQSQKKKLIKKK